MEGSYDVAIVGAGPAGSVAALALARAGRRVALIDRASFPRPKVCGNCINPRAWKVWHRLGLTESFAALPHQEMTGFAFHSENRLIYRHTFRKNQPGPRAVARDVLDAWLVERAQAAGVVFLPATTVTHVSEEGNLETSAGPLSARLILGADGRNSLVGRLCHLMPAPRRCHRIAWQTSLPAPDDLDQHVHLHVFAEGYFGLCRYSPTQAVLSLVLDSRRSQAPQQIVRRYFPALKETDWLRMSPITRGPAQPGRGRVWLVGDAARVVEPFTGEGICLALSTALLAAESMEAALATGDQGRAHARYARAHRILYWRRAWVNQLARRTLATPSHAIKLLRVLKHLPGMLTFLSDRVHPA